MFLALCTAFLLARLRAAGLGSSTALLPGKELTDARPPMLLLALAMNINDVSLGVLATVKDLCEEHVVSLIDIVVKTLVDIDPGVAAAYASCELRVTLQSEGATNITGRIARLTRIRAEQQARIIRERQNPQSPYALAREVMVVDWDLVQLPAAWKLRKYAQLFDRGWDVLCSNGVSFDKKMRPTRMYYDTFAAVLANGSWMFEGVEPNCKELHIFCRARHEKYIRRVSALEDAILQSDPVPYPMRSCFGGASMMRIEGVWDGGAQRCSYQSDSAGIKQYIYHGDVPLSILDATGQGGLGSPPQAPTLQEDIGLQACEHTRLLECVRESYPGLRVGTVSQLEVQWTAWDNQGKVIPADLTFTDLPSEQPQPLVFKQLPAMGGSALAELFVAAVPDATVEMDATMTPEDGERFVIGSVCEPCAWYLSQWGDGLVAGPGSGSSEYRDLIAECGGSCLYAKQSSATHAGMFEAWSRMARGTLGLRFNYTYPVRSAVDCWVRMESLEADARTCLRMYEEHAGGRVDWSGFNVTQARLGASLPGAGSRADTHGPCSKYYNAREMDAMLQSSDDGFLYRAFGYKTCCGGSEEDSGSTSNPTFLENGVTREIMFARWRGISANNVTAQLACDRIRSHPTQSDKWCEASREAPGRAASGRAMLSLAASSARAHMSSRPSPMLLPAANRTLDHDSTLPRRPSLMYSEMEKTASGSLRRLLPNVVKGCELPARWQGEDKPSPQGVGPKNDLDCGCYATTGPKYAASKQDRLRHFVIGSVREPCDWYVSSWSYQLEKFPEIPDPSNGSKLTMDTLKAVVPAKVSALKAFHRSEGPNPNVDCWVVTNDFSASLRRCLEMFEAQGGQVNWDFGGLVVALDPPPLDPIAKETDTGKNKNHPGVQLEHHAPCAAYFDSQTSAYIEQVDAPLYARFGWSGCCGGASQSHQRAEHEHLIVKAVANTTTQHANGLRLQQLQRGEPTCHHLRPDRTLAH